MRGYLQPYEREPVVLMTKTVTTNRLKEKIITYAPGATVQASVQPLGSEQAEKAGLIGEKERLRVQMAPSVPLTPGDHLTVRGEELNVARAEVWKSYSLAITEPL